MSKNRHGRVSSLTVNLVSVLVVEKEINSKSSVN